MSQPITWDLCGTSFNITSVNRLTMVEDVYYVKTERPYYHGAGNN